MVANVFGVPKGSLEVKVESNCAWLLDEKSAAKLVPNGSLLATDAVSVLVKVEGAPNGSEITADETVLDLDAEDGGGGLDGGGGRLGAESRNEDAV